MQLTNGVKGFPGSVLFIANQFVSLFGVRNIKGNNGWLIWGISICHQWDLLVGASRLSDDFICSILSKLPIGQAVSCSVLSQRLRFFCTKIPQLTISRDLILFDYNEVNALEIAILSNLLLMHSLDLKTFHLYFSVYIDFIVPLFPLLNLIHNHFLLSGCLCMEFKHAKFLMFLV